MIQFIISVQEVHPGQCALNLMIHEDSPSDAEKNSAVKLYSELEALFDKRGTRIPIPEDKAGSIAEAGQG